MIRNMREGGVLEEINKGRRGFIHLSVLETRYSYLTVYLSYLSRVCPKPQRGIFSMTHSEEGCVIISDLGPLFIHWDFAEEVVYFEKI